MIPELESELELVFENISMIVANMSFVGVGVCTEFHNNTKQQVEESHKRPARKVANMMCIDLIPHTATPERCGRTW